MAATETYSLEQAEDDLSALRGQVGQLAEILQTQGLLIGGAYYMEPTNDPTGAGDWARLSAALSAGQVPHLLPGSTYLLSQPLTPSGQARIVGDGPSTTLTYGTSWSGSGLLKPTGSNLRIEKMAVQTLGMSFIDWNNANTQDLKLEDVFVTCGTLGMQAATGAPMFANCNAHQLSFTDCEFSAYDPYSAVFTINAAGTGNGSGFSGAKITRCKTFAACVPTTTVAAGSTGGEISQIASWGATFGGSGVLKVPDTSGWPSSGSFWVAASGSTVASVSYTGITPTSFTGCTYNSGSATGTVATGGVVSPSSLNIAQAGARATPAWDITAPGNKNVDVIIFRDCFFSNQGTPNNGVNSFDTAWPQVICGITTAAANTDFDRLEMYACDFDAPIGGMVQAQSVDCAWLHGLSCGNIIKGALTANHDLISVVTRGGVGTGQPCTQVSVIDYCREGGGVPHGSSNPSDFACTSDTLGVVLQNMGVPDNGVSVQVNLNSDGAAHGASGVTIINAPPGLNLLGQNSQGAPNSTIVIGNGAITIGGTAITVP